MAGESEKLWRKGLWTKVMMKHMMRKIFPVKKLSSLVLTGALLCSASAAPVWAADLGQSYEFEMTAGGNQEAEIGKGEILTVTVSLSRTDAEGAYTMYAMQDDILYDTEYFELVENSMMAGNQAGGVSGSSSGIRCSVRDMSSAGEWSGYRKITASALQATGRTWSNPQIILTFQLKALKTGNTVIYTDNCLMSNEKATDSYVCQSNDLMVKVTPEPKNLSGSEGTGAQTQDPSKNGEDGEPGSGDVTDPSGAPGDNDPSETSGGGKSGFTDPSQSGSNPSGEKTGDSPFTDISTHWGKEAIEYAVEKGYFSGVSDTLFQPDGSMTRGMIVTVLWRMMGSPQAENTAAFDDVAAGSWYADAVRWASSEAIVSGYGDGRFGPTDPVTREQMMVILSGCAAYRGVPVRTEGDLTVFSDADKIAGWAEDAVSWGVGAGLLNGTGNGMLNPKGTATRAEAAKILMEADRNIWTS